MSHYPARPARLVELPSVYRAFLGMALTPPVDQDAA